MRNFWIDTAVDGRKAHLTGGLRSNDGCMSTYVYVKEHGRSVKALSIGCCPDTDGHLTIIVWDGKGNVVHKHTYEK